MFRFDLQLKQLKCTNELALAELSIEHFAKQQTVMEPVSNPYQFIGFRIFQDLIGFLKIHRYTLMRGKQESWHLNRNPLMEQLYLWGILLNSSIQMLFQMIYFQ